jgi:hypothetical protein
VTPKKRKSVRESSVTRSRSTPAPSRQLVEIRGAFQAAIGQLKALGCEDSMILVEFWHALDCVNGENRATYSRVQRVGVRGLRS